MSFVTGRRSSDFELRDFTRHAFTCTCCHQASSSTYKDAEYCQKEECQREYHRVRKAERSLRDKKRRSKEQPRDGQKTSCA